MTYFVTPILSLQLANPGTGQAFETTVVNADFVAIDTAIGADRVRLTALEGQDRSAADLDALAALASPTTGQHAVVNELSVEFIYAGAVWNQQGVSRFASTAARDTAYAKGSGAYKVNGVEALDTSTGIISRYNTTAAAWKPWRSDWITDVPTVTGVTLGNGTLSGRHRFDGGQCFVEGRLLAGSTTVITAQPKVNHVGGNADAGSFAASAWPLGKLYGSDAGVQLYTGEVVGESNTQASFYVISASTATTTALAVSSTVPWTFGTGDSYLWKYDYTPA